MIAIIFGPPGVGKGTQSALLSEKLNILHISTGDILRKAIQNKTELGIKSSKYINAGELIPDELITGMVFDAIKNISSDNGFILDGYPRNIAQTEDLDKMLLTFSKKVDVVINIVLSDDEIIKRILGRRVCDLCGRVTHVDYGAQMDSDVCEVCGGELKTRTDDTAEAIRNRLKVYYSQTLPVLDHYRARSIVMDIDGNRGKENISADILAIFKE